MRRGEQSVVIIREKVSLPWKVGECESSWRERDEAKFYPAKVTESEWLSIIDSRDRVETNW